MTDTFLSRDEQQALVALFREVPEVVEGLAAAIAASGQRTCISYEPRVSTGEKVQPLPYNEDAQIAADDLHNELGLWVQLVIDYRGVDYEDSPTQVAYARWLDHNVVALAMVPGCETAHTLINRRIRDARRAARMTRPASWRTAGTTSQARETLLHATGIALAAKELGPEYAGLTRDRVNNLRRNNHIQPVRTVPETGEQLYRLGAVMDAHLATKTRARKTA